MKNHTEASNENQPDLEVETEADRQLTLAAKSAMAELGKDPRFALESSDGERVSVRYTRHDSFSPDVHVALSADRDTGDDMFIALYRGRRSRLFSQDSEGRWHKTDIGGIGAPIRRAAEFVDRIQKLRAGNRNFSEVDMAEAAEVADWIRSGKEQILEKPYPER